MNLFLIPDVSISSQQLRVVIPVVVGLVAYMIYWFTQESEGYKKRLTRKYGEEGGSIRRIISTKYLGAFTIGVLPFLAYKIAFPDTEWRALGLGFNTSATLMSWLFIMGIGGALSLLVMLSSKKVSIQKKQPEIRVAVWSRKLIFHNMLAWAVYLLGYEFFFRGVLLYPLVDSIGLWPAIAINALMYSCVHIPKGADEAIMAIPLSVVLCLLGVMTGTIFLQYL